MRISDWSSDVCSSDLDRRLLGASLLLQPEQAAQRRLDLFAVARPRLLQPLLESIRVDLDPGEEFAAVEIDGAGKRVLVAGGLQPGEFGDVDLQRAALKRDFTPAELDDRQFGSVENADQRRQEEARGGKEGGGTGRT